MTRRLYAYLPRAGQEIEFASIANGAVQLLSRSQADKQPGTDIVFFVPSADVSCHKTKLAGQKAADLKRTAEFALEEDLAASIEDTHIAVGPRLADGRYHVHAVRPELMSLWTQQITALGYPNAKLVADASVLPGHATVLDAGDTYLVAFPDQYFALDASLPDDAIQAIFAKASAPIDAIGTNLAARLGIDAIADTTLPTLAQLAQWADASEHLTDLRQNLYSPKRDTSLNLKEWKLPAILAGVVTALFLSGLLLENYNLGRLDTAMQQQARDVYAANNPNRPVPQNLSQAVQQASPNSKAPTLDFLNATALLYSALPTDDTHSIRGLRFNAETGRLVASMTYPAYGADLDLKRVLESKGLVVTLGDSRQQDDHVLGDVTMEAAQ